MHYVALSGADSWYNLPRIGGVAYAAQESWVQNETIRVRLQDFVICPSLISLHDRTIYYLVHPMKKTVIIKVNIPMTGVHSSHLVSI